MILRIRAWLLAALLVACDRASPPECQVVRFMPSNLSDLVCPAGHIPEQLESGLVVCWCPGSGHESTTYAGSAARTGTDKDGGR